MVKETLIKVMKDRGFSLEKVLPGEYVGSSFVFINETELQKYYEQVIIVEVYAKGVYHFYYTQSGMLGFMDSGQLNDIWDNDSFKYNYTLFHNQVNLLRGNTL